jgi:hypothetical protein
LLERVVGGDFYEQTSSLLNAVAPSTTLTADVMTLAASLNKYSRVDLGYMSKISGMLSDNLKENLHGRIFYNPLERNMK